MKSESTPTVHLNGTSRESLLIQVSDAAHALDAAWTALCAMAPHGRDYYPQGVLALRDAEREHSARLDAISTVYLDLMALWERIDQAGRSC
jgi:hypothetical protein